MNKFIVATILGVISLIGSVIGVGLIILGEVGNQP